MPRKIANSMAPDRKNFYTYLGIAVLVLILCWHLFSSYGLVGYFHLKKELAGLQAENDRLQQQNSQLLHDLKRFKDDDTYFSEIARKQHGMIKKNEVIFDFGKEH